MDIKVLVKEAKSYIGGRIELLFMLFDEQQEILQKYKYVDTQLIEETWDKHIKFMSYYMGVSEETYKILWEYYLDGHVESLNINSREDLLDYLACKKIGRDITQMSIEENPV